MLRCGGGCLRRSSRLLPGALSVAGVWWWVWLLAEQAHVHTQHRHLQELLNAAEQLIGRREGDNETEEVEQDMRMRIHHMKEACHRHKLDVVRNDNLHQPNPWEFFLEPRHKLVWCNIFKSASTSWMYVFNLLAGYSPAFLNRTRQIPLMLARAKYPRPNRRQLANMLAEPAAVSFLVARNPFERLVSAFRDKLLGALKMSPHDKLRRNLVSRYRNIRIPPRGKLPERLKPTFEEFVRFVIDQHKAREEPDMHWAPAYKYIMEKAAIRRIVRVARRNSAKEGSSSLVTDTYLRQLPRELYHQLLDIYQIDFDIFGYEPKTYEQLSRPAFS